MANQARVLCPLGSPVSNRRGAPPLMPGDVVDVDDWVGMVLLTKDGMCYGFLSEEEASRNLERIPPSEWRPL